MTWKELKKRIEKMSEEDQEKNVTVWTEEQSRDAVLSQCSDDLYWNNNWGCSYLKSELAEEEINDPSTHLVARKGHYYLDFFY